MRALSPLSEDDCVPFPGKLSRLCDLQGPSPEECASLTKTENMNKRDLKRNMKRPENTRG